MPLHLPELAALAGRGRSVTWLQPSGRPELALDTGSGFLVIDRGLEGYRWIKNNNNKIWEA